MLKKEFWITVALGNLCIVPLFGVILRTKFLFDIPFIDYNNVLNAHSHFAFSGWITLMLMIYFINNLLPATDGSKKKYQYILWVTQLTALGMALTFPFTGYGPLAIIFSTVFIFATYAFSWIFIKDFLKTKREKTVSLLTLSAVACLVISSLGPFTLAYLMATKSGNSILFRDALYMYLHFQYNGYFTLAVFALFIHHIQHMVDEKMKRRIYLFSVFLVFSIAPALFLSLTWHPGNTVFHILAVIGCMLTFFALILFLSFIRKIQKQNIYRSRISSVLWMLSMISFVIKLLLQMGTILPDLATMVFAYRPIIIGFLHLVFLGFVTFFLLAQLVDKGSFDWNKKITKISLLIFAVAIIMNETVLLIQGIGLLFYSTNSIFAWLLWLISLLLFVGSIVMLIARIKTIQPQV